MKIPSEAELIEMERRSQLPSELLDYLGLCADHLSDRIERADSDAEETRLTLKLRMVEDSIEAIARLEEDFSTLIELVRQGAWVVQDAR